MNTRIREASLGIEGLFLDHSRYDYRAHTDPGFCVGQNRIPSLKGSSQAAIRFLRAPAYLRDLSPVILWALRISHALYLQRQRPPLLVLL